MIIIKIKGGLGNQMFQYAFAKAFALEKKEKFKIDISIFKTYKLHNYALNHFTCKPEFYKKENKYFKKIKSKFFKYLYFNEDDYNFNFNGVIYNLKANYKFFEGYFQTEKYFLKYEKEIRAEFKIKSPLKKETIETIEYMKKVKSVSIHFRRGDYIGNPFHDTDKTKYYNDAIRVIESKIDNPVYFLFSDDMKWVKENFKSNFETHFIDFNDVASNYEDLKLMSSCEHNIITNSSFSWWGAWLNTNTNKIVIAPKEWFNDENINTIDVIPTNWIKI